MRIDKGKLLGLAVAVLLGAMVGLGSFTFLYGEGISYFSTDPKSCMNCHIMRPQYDSWSKSSHHAAAKCVDCHLPHTFIPKYIAKADNGYRHSKAFTLQDFHEPIQITPRNSRILQNNCVTCHSELVHPLVAGSSTATNAISCVHCHADVGHGPRAGLGR
jgi:cytochrome c nitrite reductase small subunit